MAGPVWPRHAPILFPIVGRLRNDELGHRRKPYQMGQHGFARNQRFNRTEQTTKACTLVLTDNAETRSHFPSGFA